MLLMNGELSCGIIVDAFIIKKQNYKIDFGVEKYITCLPDVYVYALMKFRCSCHKLSIEVGRFHNIPREERMCSKCNMSVLGDEFHFIMVCPHFKHLRQDFIPRHFLQPMSSYNFCRLMKCKSQKVLSLSKFIRFAGIS